MKRYYENCTKVMEPVRSQKTGLIDIYITQLIGTGAVRDIGEKHVESVLPAHFESYRIAGGYRPTENRFLITPGNN